MRLSVAKTLVVGLVFGLSAFGDVVTIFNTGEGTLGGPALATGVTDPHYTLTSAPATVPLTAITTVPNAAWHVNTATADWISPGSSGDTSWPVGNYDYQTSFDLTGLNPATAQLSGSWTSDNDACIFLNGVKTTSCTGFADFGSLLSFSLTSGFVSGVNKLDFIVDNGGGPTGVFAEVSGTASPGTSAVPEPSSLVFLGAVLLGLFTVPRLRQAYRR
jgi:hypothetical protein